MMQTQLPDLDGILALAQQSIQQFSLLRLIQSIGILLIAAALLVLLQRVVRKHELSGKNGIRTTLMRVSIRLVRLLIVVGAILLILQANGVNVSSLLAGLGIAGAAVGLALQDLLKDVIMGIHILGDGFFSIGDCVEWQGRELQIVKFSLKTTTAMDLDDHSVLHLCNRNIESIRCLGTRQDVDISLSYDENTAEMTKLLSGLAQEIGDLEKVTRCEYKGIQSFESSAVLHRLRLYCAPQNRPEARRAALGLLKTRLDEAGIKIPFGQLDVHFDKE